MGYLPVVAGRIDTIEHASYGAANGLAFMVFEHARLS
jgi:hypothetical protein